MFSADVFLREPVVPGRGDCFTCTISLGYFSNRLPRQIPYISISSISKSLTLVSGG